MSTSGFGQIPASNSATPPTNSRADRSEVVKIIRLPDALQNNARAVRIEGTITQINNNGSARIQTERGAVDVQLANNAANRPEVGQRLEVNIPAGNPPRQASIRAEASTTNQTDPRGVPQNTAQNTAQAAPRSTQGGAGASDQTAARPQNTAPQNAIPPHIQSTARPAQTAPTAPLPEGAQVRLVAVPPSQANQIAAQTQTAIQNPANIQNAVIARAVFNANIIASNALNAVTQSALTIAPQSITPAPNLNIQSLNNPTQGAVNSQFISNTTPAALIQSPTITFSTPPSQALPLGSQSPTQAAFLNTSQVLNNGNNSLSVLPQNAIITTNTSLNNVPTNAFTPNASLIPQGLNNPSLQTGFAVQQAINKIDVQVLQITPPNVTLTAPGTTAQNTIPALTQFTPPVISQNNAVTLTAQVTGFNTAGQPLVTLQLPGTPLPQSFALQYTPNNIALGSQIKINVQSIGVIPIVSTTNQASPALSGLLQGFQWGAFDEMVQTFIQQSPQAASALIRSMPNAGNPAQLGAAGVMAMAAIRGGDLSNWLGDKKIDMLQRLTKGSLTGRLVQDSAAPRADAASNADWRAVPLPMFWEGEIHKITLFMRQENQNPNQNNDKEGSTRFVFDLDLSRMGDVQIDGLLRDKRLDLVIRTQNGFSQPMQQVMRAAYSNAINMAQMAGDLSFQGNTDKWVHVIKESGQLGVSI